MASSIDSTELSESFFNRPVIEVAKDLIGCQLSNDGVTGEIVETEAYHCSEPACHGFNGPTERSEVIFRQPGTVYVYRSYGIHSLLNFVAEESGVGAAVLIRALRPLDGLEEMRGRRGNSLKEVDLCSGPGKLTQALDIGLKHNGGQLGDSKVALTSVSDRGDIEIISGPRIGISKAVDLPWRFAIKGSRYVSRPRL